MQDGKAGAESASARSRDLEAALAPAPANRVGQCLLRRDHLFTDSGPEHSSCFQPDQCPVNRTERPDCGGPDWILYPGKKTFPHAEDFPRCVKGGLKDSGDFLFLGGGCASGWVVVGSVSEHGGQDAEQMIGYRSEGATMAVPSSS